MLELVEVDGRTGEVTVAGRIDRESFSWINLTVKASDGGFPIRSSFVPLYIQVSSTISYLIKKFYCFFFCFFFFIFIIFFFFLYMIQIEMIYNCIELLFRYWMRTTTIRILSTLGPTGRCRRTSLWVSTYHQLTINSKIFLIIIIWDYFIRTGTVIGSVHAYDADIGDFGHVTYLMDRRSSKVTKVT